MMMSYESWGPTRLYDDTYEEVLTDNAADDSELPIDPDAEVCESLTENEKSALRAAGIDVEGVHILHYLSFYDATHKHHITRAEGWSHEESQGVEYSRKGPQLYMLRNEGGLLLLVEMLARDGMSMREFRKAMKVHEPTVKEILDKEYTRRHSLEEEVEDELDEVEAEEEFDRTSMRCAGKTITGNSCTKKALKCSIYCMYHEDHRSSCVYVATLGCKAGSVCGRSCLTGNTYCTLHTNTSKGSGKTGRCDYVYRYNPRKGEVCRILCHGTRCTLHIDSKEATPVTHCPYVFRKGARKGEICGGNTRNGYCGKHIRYKDVV